MKTEWKKEISVIADITSIITFIVSLTAIYYITRSILYVIIFIIFLVFIFTIIRIKLKEILGIKKFYSKLKHYNK
jgi:predicted PurR-regulated permease PerM